MMGSNTRRLCLPVLLVSALWAAGRAEGSATYSVRDLGDIRPTGLSATGAIVGRKLFTEDGTRGPIEVLRTIVLDPATGVAIPIAGTDSRYARYWAAISPSGTIAYERPAEDSINLHAHLMTDGSPTDLGSIADHHYHEKQSTHSTPYGVNDDGTVVGVSLAEWDNSHAFASVIGPSWSPGRHLVDLGTLGGKNSGATDVNSQGQIVGQADNGVFGAHAFVGEVSDYGFGMGHDESAGGIGDIGTLGGKNSTALAINDNGQVVGASNIHDETSKLNSDTTFSTREAVHAFLYDDGKMADLGVADGFSASAANDINNEAQIVGTMFSYSPDLYHQYEYFGGGSGSHAFLYDDGTIKDLNSLLEPDGGWELQSAVSINDLGQILGKGTYLGQSRAFLLTPGPITPSPVPEPSTLAVLGLAVAAWGIWRLRLRA